MAAPLRYGLGALGFSAIKIAQNPVAKHAVHSAVRVSASTQFLPLSQPHSKTQARHLPTFMNTVTAEQLWAGATGVSNAGRKRGRGKRVGRKKQTDLNKGQHIGVGVMNMSWPGLTDPVTVSKRPQAVKVLPPNPEYKNELVKLRDTLSRIRYPRMDPLSRGWTGKWSAGRAFRAPDKIADYEFTGFEARILEFKLVTNMTGAHGRKQRFSALVAVGNKNGLVGIGLGKAQKGRSAVKLATNKAAQRLQYIERFDNHTVFHNMYCHQHRSKIFIHKKEKGYGLRCHRCIKTLCSLIGITDLHCKVEGSTGNVNVISKSFVETLVKQETHQQLADRVGYHVVETRTERNHLPVVVASPSDGIVQTNPLQDEDEDLEMAFERLYYGGRVQLQRGAKRWFYESDPSYIKKQRIVNKRRNQQELKLMTRAGLTNV